MVDRFSGSVGAGVKAPIRVTTPLRHLKPCCAAMLASALALAGCLLLPAIAQAQLQPTPTPSWHTNGAVKSIVYLNGVVYVAGSFSTVSDAAGQTVRRSNLAAITLSTGVVTSWNPGANGPVLAIATDGGSTIYAGGPFTRIGVAPRGGLAAISTSGAVLPWQGQVGSGEVHVLRFAPGRLYVGGGFTWVNGVKRPNLAVLDPTTGALQSWNPAPDGIVWAIRVDGKHVFIGGDFQYVGGSRQSHIAALSPVTGRPLPWSFYPYQASVLSLGEANGVLVVGMAGNGGRVAAIRISTGRAIWIRWADGNVKAVTITDGELVVGGHFMNLCSSGSGEPCGSPVPAHHLVALSLSTGAPTGWQPSMNGVLGTYALCPLPSGVIVGGDFTKVGGVSQPYYAQFGLTA